jgi:hypothetical protein
MAKKFILIDQVCGRRWIGPIIVEFGTPHLWFQSGDMTRVFDERIRGV